MTNVPKPPSSRVKPTLETKFHIDYSWWERDGRDLRTYLISHLPPIQRAQFEGGEIGAEVDYVDPDTAEVRVLDSLSVAIQNATKSADFLATHATLVDAVFRVFLANGNKPLSVNELSDDLNRPPLTILKTLSATTGVIYKGLRPLIED